MDVRESEDSGRWEGSARKGVSRGVRGGDESDIGLRELRTALSTRSGDPIIESGILLAELLVL